MTKTLKTFLTEDEDLPDFVSHTYSHSRGHLLTDEPQGRWDDVTFVTHHKRPKLPSYFYVQGEDGEQAQNALRATLSKYNIHPSEMPEAQVVFHGHLDSPMDRHLRSLTSFLTSPEEPKHNPEIPIK